MKHMYIAIIHMLIFMKLEKQLSPSNMEKIKQ